MENKKSNKGKITALVILAVAVLIFVGVFAYKEAGKKLKYGVEAYTVVSDYFKQPEYSLLVAYDDMTDKDGFYTEAVLHKNTIDGKEISTVVWNDMTAHYCEDKFYFENGTAFEAENIFDEFKNIFFRIGDIYNAVEVSKQEIGDNAQYDVTVSDKELFSSLAEVIGITDTDNIPDMYITVVAQNDKLSSINIYADDPQTKQTKFVVDISALDYMYEISADTAQMIINGEPQNTLQLSDIQLLAKAWENYFNYNVYGANISIDLESKLLGFDESFTMLSTKENGKDITCIKRGSFELFIVDGQLYTERWGKINDIEATVFTNTGKIVDVLYQLCLSQEFEITKENSKTFYRIEMTKEECENLLNTVFRQTGIEINFDRGYVAVELEGDKLTDLEFGCEGKVDAVISEIKMELDVEIDFFEAAEDSIKLPDSVK